MPKIVYTVIILTLLVTLTGCSLPEMTPPTVAVEPGVTPSSQPPIITEEPAPAVGGEPEFINSQNVPLLKVTHRSPISSAQQIQWAADSQIIAVLTQTQDGSGNTLSGVSRLQASDLKPLSVFRPPSGRVAAISPDGKSVAVISSDLTTVTLNSLENGNLIQLSKPGYLIGNLSYSPDQTKLAVTKQELWEVVLFDAAGAELRVLSGFETAAPVFDAGFSLSPQWIVWKARGTLQLQEVETGVLSASFNHEDFVSAYALSPDGTILASCSAKTISGNSQPVILLWDTLTGQEIRTLLPNGSVSAVTFSPDGILLAAAVGDSLQIWDPAAGKMVASFTGHADTINLVAFSPDQKTIATAGVDNQLHLWQVMP